MFSPATLWPASTSSTRIAGFAAFTFATVSAANSSERAPRTTSVGMPRRASAFHMSTRGFGGAPAARARRAFGSVLGRVVDKGERGDAPRVPRGVVGGALRAQRVACEDRAFPAEVIDERADVERHRRHRVLARPIRVAKAAQVEGRG